MGKKKKSKLFKNKRTWKIFSWMIALGLLAGLIVFGAISPVAETTFFKVEQGATVSSAGNVMKDDGIIYSRKLFAANVLLFGGRIQSGTYEIPSGASMWRIARMMARGDIASVAVVIPEGMTVKQIKKLLLDTPTLSGSVECSQDVTPPAGGVGRAPVCKLKDGELFPDTYRVPRGMDRLAVLELARKKMENIRIGWENSGRPMPSPLKSWNEVITLASIVQKETPMASEMPTVASVYLNRLKKKMRLQADPTVVYAITDGLGDMQGRGLFTGHLKTASPYNTYTNYGLPPAPIANVGRDAISAVLDPADTTYLFFVADGMGGHKFSRSYEEHQKNHADWRLIKKSINTKNN